MKSVTLAKPAVASFPLPRVCLEVPTPAAPLASSSLHTPTSLDELRARERQARSPLHDAFRAHLSIVAGALHGAIGINAGPMFGYEAEYINARTAARIEVAVVGLLSGVGVARLGVGSLAALRGGVAAATQSTSVASAATGAAIATAATANAVRPIESRSIRRDPLGSVQVAVDDTGKAHKSLPNVETLKSLPSDELRALKVELEASVEQRIRKTTELGSDRGHAARQWHEQGIIRLIDKILTDRRQ